MTSFSCILIGNETLLTHCGDMIVQNGHQIKAVVTRDADIRAWAEGQSIPVKAPGKDLAKRLNTTCDWLLSIANLSLIPDNVLALATKGAINFHDGPLPQYAGLNVPVWALLNGEKQHGITWHMIEGDVDEGAIIDQRFFDIADDETALTLNTKCFAAAIDGFADVLAQLEADQLNKKPQDLSQRQMFLRADRPEAVGCLDFTKEADDLLRLIRALDHGSYLNPLACPKILSGTAAFIISAAKPSNQSGTPGAILAINNKQITVATGSSALDLEITDMNGDPLLAADMPAIGDQLPLLTKVQKDDINSQNAQYAAAEQHWRKVLRTTSGVDLSEVTQIETPQPQTRQLDINDPKDKIAAAYYALFAQLQDTDSIMLALQCADADPTNALYTNWVPLTAIGNTFGNLADNISKELAQATKSPGFARDLIARTPDLTKPMTHAGITLATATLVENTAITLSLQNEQPKIIFDSNRVQSDLIDRLIARLIHLIGNANDETQLSNLIILPDAERTTILNDWNDTATDYERTCIHILFEDQVTRTPDQTALVFEDQTLTYAELNIAANQAAHVLRDMGVKPGMLVGLHTKRSTDMLVGALGILKAGGAYVPMDPAFPADRLALYIQDSEATILVTQSDIQGQLPNHNAKTLALDNDPRLQTAPETNLESVNTPDDLAYVIFTSGSTGRPKGVMVEHGNVANFFAGMDDRIDHDANSVWLAVTSLSFDISVLELFYTLARGFKLVLSSDENRALVSNGPSTTMQNMDFSLYYWGSNDTVSHDRYDLLLEGAKFADENGFCAVWTPERHFHAFGGSYPNPSVTGAAVAAITKNLAVRAGSIVAPLHHPARIAEEWAVIDNLTGGRVGLAMASGWQPDDFVLRPENTPPHNKTALAESIDQVRRLWAGEAVEFPRADGKMHAVVTQPRPLSKKIPMWVTTAGNPATWEQAGEVGANVLTHLLGQSVEEVGEKIKLYHAALRKAGHDPKDHKVTLMLHTFIADDREVAREIAREPMKDYLRSAAALIKQYAWAFPAFKKPAGAENAFDLDLGSLEPEELEAILDFAFQRYFEDSGLFGTVEDSIARVETLKKIGVDEVACLIEYGIDNQTVLDSLRPLAKVVAATNGSINDQDFSIAAQIKRHQVTHLQCTPSMARIICMNEEASTALSHVKHLMIGGEAFSGSLVQDLASFTNAAVENMYGPTETTIWSTTETVSDTANIINIGRPIANTQTYVLNDNGDPVPIGMVGELYIGGAGVTRGYWKRDDLTLDRFVPNPFGDKPAKMYRTGDLVRMRHDGKIDFLGRADHQVKLRGYRIELGEIEARLDAIDGITQSIVIAREDTLGDTRLVAYFKATRQIPDDTLRKGLAVDLPTYMVPAHFVKIDSFPLTPNKKVDRKELPAPMQKAAIKTTMAKPQAAIVSGDVEAQIAEIWTRFLGVPQIGPNDNFFALGGHSLLAVQVHREMRDTLGLNQLAITDIFRFPTLAGIKDHLGLTKSEQSKAHENSESRAQSRTDAMARRRNMRANRGR